MDILLGLPAAFFVFSLFFGFPDLAFLEGDVLAEDALEGDVLAEDVLEGEDFCPLFEVVDFEDEAPKPKKKKLYSIWQDGEGGRR